MTFNRYIFFICAILLLCISCSSKSNNEQLLVLKESVIGQRNRGTLQKKNRRVILQKINKVQFDMEGKGFILDFLDLEHLNNKYYTIGGTDPQILVFDSIGHYIKSILAKVTSANSCSYYDIEVLNENTIFLKDVNNFRIIQIDSTGDVHKIWSSKNTQLPGINVLAPMGMSIVKDNNEMNIFSEIYQVFEDGKTPLKKVAEETLTKTLMIGKFDPSGKLIQRFATHNPLYEKYNFLVFQPADFVIFGKKLFLIESALPYIRSYDIETGALFSQFGEWGLHQRPVVKIPWDSLMVGRRLSFAYTGYTSIFIIQNLVNYNKPVLAVEYSNLYNTLENINRRGWREGDRYLMLYDLNGELLLNDLKLPGEFICIDGKDRLFLLLEDNPSKRVIGIYKLCLTS